MGKKFALFCCWIKKKGGAHGSAPRTVASRCLRGISRDAVTCRGGALPAADRRRPRFSAYAARDGLTYARHRPRLYMSPLNYRTVYFLFFFPPRSRSLCCLPPRLFLPYPHINNPNSRRIFPSLAACPSHAKASVASFLSLIGSFTIVFVERECRRIG